MTKKIIFTGGGSAGHVTPNIVLIEAVQALNWQVAYVGSKDGVEANMIQPRNIPFYSISSGKLRRYFSWKNFLDPFRIIAGIVQSYFLLKRLKADILFSKGGFVAFPVVVGAWLNRIPVVAHESDLSPGLANRLSYPFIDKICVTFEAAKSHFKDQGKVVVTGTPIRPQLLKGDKGRGLSLCGFNESKPCLLVIGGSLGALNLNRAIRQNLAELTKKYQIIHLCGKGKMDNTLKNTENYCQFEYAKEELADLFATSDSVVSRAGANALYEILFLEKPHVLVPLSAKASRGDQIQNAQYFAKLNISVIVDDDTLASSNHLLTAIDDVDKRKQDIIKNIQALQMESATSQILAQIKEQLRVECPQTA